MADDVLDPMGQLAQFRQARVRGSSVTQGPQGFDHRVIQVRHVQDHGSEGFGHQMGLVTGPSCRYVLGSPFRRIASGSPPRPESRSGPRGGSRRHTQLCRPRWELTLRGGQVPPTTRRSIAATDGSPADRSLSRPEYLARPWCISLEDDPRRRCLATSREHA